MRHLRISAAIRHESSTSESGGKRNRWLKLTGDLNEGAQKWTETWEFTLEKTDREILQAG